MFLTEIILTEIVLAVLFFLATVSLPRNGCITDRLYGLAKEKHLEKQMQREMAANGPPHDLSTAAVPAQHRGKSTTTDPDHVSKLHEKGTLYQKRREKRAQLEQKQANDLSRKSKANPNSLRIAKNLQNSKERLQRPLTKQPSPKKMERRRRVEQDMYKESATFRPTLNKKSIKMAQSNGYPIPGPLVKSPSESQNKSAEDGHYEKQVLWHKRIEERNRKSKTNQEKDELDACTFKPQKIASQVRLRKKKDKVNQATGETEILYADVGGGTIYEKNQIWMQERQRKMLRCRQEKEILETQECTFQPKTLVGTGAGQSQVDTLALPDATEIHGEGGDSGVGPNGEYLDFAPFFHGTSASQVNSPIKNEHGNYSQSQELHSPRDDDDDDPDDKPSNGSNAHIIKGRAQILPPGWMEYTTADGKLYYHNLDTNKTQWAFPEIE
jgi:hypothetical protein